MTSVVYRETRLYQSVIFTWFPYRLAGGPSTGRDVGDIFGAVEFDFQVKNTGGAPIKVPVWPHLADLQPADERQSFDFLAMTLTLRADPEPSADRGRTLGPVVAHVTLYGAERFDGSILTLNPGEWVEVRAQVKLEPPQSPLPPASILRGSFFLSRDTFRPLPGGQFMDSRSLYPKETLTPGVPVRFVAPRERRPGN